MKRKKLTLARAGIGALLLVGVCSRSPAPRALTPVDSARIATRFYARQAFPLWRARHAPACPASLDELSPRPSDPWGTRYAFLCGPRLPPGATGIRVVSAGPDRQFGTADDIWSDR